GFQRRVKGRTRGNNRKIAPLTMLDRFVDALTEATRKLTVGPALTGAFDQGPLIDAKAVDKVEELIADATAMGASVSVGGERDALGATFFRPTVLCDVPKSARIAKEEIFGPVAPVFRFSDEQEAIDMANDTEFGLASYLFTQDLSRAIRVAEAIESGMVGVNSGIISTELAPFGGVKESGLGREGSSYGLEDYTELKYLCLSI
ncbi:MAG: aldehyde dehydrogenase family protein, partial [Rhodobacteraceae bacterium]|nr:aldehyde dehydrogenase family protein [Paracoccaceae bacterium]